MISQSKLQIIRDAYAANVPTLRYLISGETKTVPVSDVRIEGETIRIIGIVPEGDTGDITKIELIDTSGNVFEERIDLIEKGTRYMMVVFDDQLGGAS